MSGVAAFLGPGVSIHEESFTDLTDVAVTRIGFLPDGRLGVSFDDDLPLETRLAVKRRMQATSPAEETLLTTLADATTPDQTDLAARVAALEARVDMLTQLVSGETD